MAKRYNYTSYSKSVQTDKWEIVCKEHAGTTFSPVHQPWESQWTALQTDRRTDDSMMPIADHLVYQLRSAKNVLYEIYVLLWEPGMHI